MIIAGIGARVTPMDALMKLEQIGMTLAMRGIAGRSGGAAGADTAFARGYSVIAPGLLKVYPGNIGHYVEWQQHAAYFHPAWNNCDEHTRKLHARNSAIMCGDRPMTAPELVDAVVCWTEGGAIKGGTGQALRIAAYEQYRIPVFNLGDPACNISGHSAVDAFWLWLDSRNVK